MGSGTDPDSGTTPNLTFADHMSASLEPRTEAGKALMAWSDSDARPLHEFGDYGTVALAILAIEEQAATEAHHAGALTTAFIGSLMDRLYKDGGAEPMRTSMDYDEVEAALWAVASGAATEARRELLAKVEGLGIADGRDNLETYGAGWNSAIDAVLRLIEESDRG